MKKNLKSIVIITLLFIFLIMYLKDAVLMMNQFIDYSIIFLTKFLPVSFPILMISNLLLKYGINYYIPGGATTSSLILSLISGFPNGTKYIQVLVQQKNISVKTGNRLLMVNHFPNPLFIFGTVYLVINSYSLTWKLYISIILSNLIILLFLKKEKTKTEDTQFKKEDFARNLYSTILSSSQTILLIYGTSIFFYLLLALITKYISFSFYEHILLCGLFDLTKGVLTTSLIESTISRSILILFFISFGGISIHMQVKSILSDTPLSYYYFLLGRIISTLLAFLFFFLFTC